MENRLSQTVTLGAGSPATTGWTYNPLNQITNPGYTDDKLGNLTSNSVTNYAATRAMK